jgi:hypothetical protein
MGVFSHCQSQCRTCRFHLHEEQSACVERRERQGGEEEEEEEEEERERGVAEVSSHAQRRQSSGVGAQDKGRTGQYTL